MGSSNSAQSYSFTVCIQCTHKIQSGIHRVSTEKMLRSPPVTEEVSETMQVFFIEDGAGGGG